VRYLGWVLCCGLLACELPPSVAWAADSKELDRPFNGRNLDGWLFQSPPAKGQWANHWTVGAAVIDAQDPAAFVVKPAAEGADMINARKQSLNAYTQATYGDCTIALEFLLAQGSNSGVYVMGEYEVQIRDDFGKGPVTFQGMGAVYKIAPPRVNAARQPGQWQQLLIEFRAPRFQDGKKTACAKFVRVVLNGQTLHEGLEAPDVTPGGLTGKEAPRGPLMLQGDHGPVAYRNITITPN